MILPASDSNGQYLSYSQLQLWKDTKSFNLRIEGKLEYIRKYFLGEKYPPTDWALFGTHVEGYVRERKFEQHFSDEEKEVLHQITPYDIYERKIRLQFPEFSVIGYVDDTTSDFSKVRDYKTGSANSVKKYYSPDYKQLEIYGLATYQEQGIFPDLEVCMIERKGNCMFGGGRSALTVGTNIWYRDIKPSTSRLKEIENEILEIATDISDHYELFMELNN